jgi:Putative DNA-binding domain
MLETPTTIGEIDRLVADGVQESIHLEYKSSAAIDVKQFDEVARDVSSFANSDGGIIIYGVQEKGHLPIGKDGGVDHTKYNRERLENIISSGISPRIDDLRITQIPLTPTTSIYTVAIPKSFRGPHQARQDKKYYKRFNFKREPMEDYEINDIRARRKIIRPIIEIGISIRHRVLIHMYVSNIGEQTAENVTFELPNKLRAWAEKEGARLFINGVKYFPPKRTFSFRLGHTPALLKDDDDSLSRFDIGVSYEHPELHRRISEVFHIDLMDFWGSYTGESDIYELGKEIKEAAKKLTDEIGKLNGNFSRLTSMAGATGLDLSVSSMRNLKHILAGDEPLEKLNPASVSHNVFMEVLGVDVEIACRLSDFFYRGNESNGLDAVEGVTVETIERIKKHFILQEA